MLLLSFSFHFYINIINLSDFDMLFYLLNGIVYSFNELNTFCFHVSHIIDYETMRYIKIKILTLYMNDFIGEREKLKLNI